jgi:hypothetical protein
MIPALVSDAQYKAATRKAKPSACAPHALRDSRSQIAWQDF